MRKHIPNLITGLNAVSGALAVFMALYGQIVWAACFIIAGMIFDFFDGMAARLLHVKSEIGKELDSLADMVSFGVAPAVLACFLMMKELPGGDLSYFQEWTVVEKIAVFMPLIIVPFSAYRLAKFNLDARQSASFIGVPTPANALFWICLVFSSFYTPEIYAVLFGNLWVLMICVLLFSFLLISELPMFSLKISGFGWKGNKIRYTYFISLLVLACIWGKAILVFIIPLYILFNLVGTLFRITTSDRLPDHN